MMNYYGELYLASTFHHIVVPAHPSEYARNGKYEQPLELCLESG
jgi:hypothetical protein